jgi:2'-5' RNA ligase
MKRLFIAIKINCTKEFISFLNHIESELTDEVIKWIKPANIHITLAFLGNTKEQLIPELSEALSKITCDFAPFNLTLKGCGVFKNLQNPNVIWAGIDADNIIFKLKTKLDFVLENFGFAVDKRPFKPHLTIGRPKSIRNKELLKELLNKYQEKVYLKQEVENLILFESLLYTTDPVYEEIKVFNLSLSQNPS